MSEREIFALFRYRDLVAKTIEAHRSIIVSKAACWWGWWRRPNEGDRLDVWKRLREKIADDGQATIGLFDSGSRNNATCVRIATVTGVVAPPEAESEPAPGIPTGEGELVPKYYRKSPFSRAWLKLSFIDEEPLGDFFEKYSYAELPPLRGIPPKYLGALRGKRVCDSEELRIMDTTIWVVRKVLDTDRTERFLAPSTQVSAPITVDPIPLAKSSILHLTDLHFATGVHRNQHAWGIGEDGETTLAESVSVALKDRVGAIVISGDFTFCASKDEFDQAGRSIFSLLSSLNVPPQNLIMVPGNHDLVWTELSGEVFAGKGVGDVALSPPEATEAYRDFYASILGHDADKSLSMGRRFVLPMGMCVDVCALNSSNLASGPGYLPGMGRVGAGEFERVRQALGWTSRNHSSLRILVLHHHLTQTEDFEDPSEFSKGFGMAVDAKRILRDAARVGVDVVLHGHRHRAFVWRESVFALPDNAVKEWELGEVNIVGGGTAGSSHGNPPKAHHVNLFEFTPDMVQLEIHRSDSMNGFQLVQTWIAKLEVRDGGLRMGGWRLG